MDYEPNICDECQAYGDDVTFDENGELQSMCPDCIFNDVEDYLDD